MKVHLMKMSIKIIKVETHLTQNKNYKHPKIVHECIKNSMSHTLILNIALQKPKPNTQK